MNDDMMSRLSDILDDPKAMEKIKSIAESLGGGGTSSSDTDVSLPSSASEGISENVFSGFDLNIDSGRAVALLEALRPFMRQSRIPKVNTAIKAVQMMSVLSKIK